MDHAIDCIRYDKSDGRALNILVMRSIGRRRLRVEQKILSLYCAVLVPIGLKPRSFIEENPVQARMDAVGFDQVGNQGFHKLGKRLSLRQSIPHGSEAIIDMPPPDGPYQRDLVRKVLIQRSDTNSGRIGNLVGRETSPSLLAQNASPSLDHRFHRSTRSGLLRLLAHGRLPL